MLQQRQIEWQRLDSLLKSYEKLYSEEQSFLVEVKFPTLRNSYLLALPLTGNRTHTVWSAEHSSECVCLTC